MKNRDYKKLVTIATAVALIVGSLGAVSSPTLAKDTKTTAQTTTAEKKTTKEKEAFGASLCQKDKTAPPAPSETVQGALSLRFRECCGDQSADR